MNKSVYSLVLMDRVVEEIDKLAYAMNTSRSNLINQILAERVCCITPEHRTKIIFENLDRCIKNVDYLKVQIPSSDSMISIRSILKYKYNPTIRYNVEIYKNLYPVMGKIKVSLRTQNPHLLMAILDAFKTWMELEESYSCEYLKNEKIDSKIEDGKYVRLFKYKNETNQDDIKNIGDEIARYIESFDSCLKAYFKELGNVDYSRCEMEKCYIKFLKEGFITI